jgi:hypothetical protein
VEGVTDCCYGSVKVILLSYSNEDTRGERKEIRSRVRSGMEPARLPYSSRLPHWGLLGLHSSAYSGRVFRTSDSHFLMSKWSSDKSLTGWVVEGRCPSAKPTPCPRTTPQHISLDPPDHPDSGIHGTTSIVWRIAKTTLIFLHYRR